MDEKESVFKRLKDVSPVRLIVISFLMIIVIGTILLTLPLASRSGKTTNLVDALFVSTSATCVTGLTPFDTWTHWSGFGQAVILILIQLGGLGLVSFATGFTLILRRKLGLRDMQIVREYTSGDVMNTPRLIRTIIIWTFSCEAVGSLLLALRFVPMFGAHGIWLSVFTAVSAYCNAGFDILGFMGENMSLIHFASDPLVCITVALLIIIGGIGFIVISDLHGSVLKRFSKAERHFHFTLHTHIVLRMTAFLLLIGTALYMVFEYHNTLEGRNFFDKLNISFFQSASARTAGFASVDIGSQFDVTKMMTIFLMFIGASPSSTGGGIKTTTFVVLISTMLSVLRGRTETTILKRRVDKTTVYRALSIVILSLCVVFLTVTVITIAEPDKSVPAIAAVYEAVSAFATVGLTTGVTPILSDVSLVALIVTMFIGRVGPISLVLALSMRHTNANQRNSTILPEGKVIVG